MEAEPSKQLTMQELPELRRKTEALSQFLRKQINSHLETLRPLLSPENVFGKYAGGRTDVTGADRAVSELQQAYRPFVNKPYDLPRDFDTHWLALVGSGLDVYPWEYAHSIQGKTITMSSPLRWVVNFRTHYTLTHLKDVLAGKEPVRAEHLRQFVVNALVLQLVVARNPGLTQLFTDLRYDLRAESPEDLRGLRVMTINSILPSFRPADDLIAAATAFSGVPAFIELADLEAVRNPRDILKEKLEGAIASI